MCRVCFAVSWLKVCWFQVEGEGLNVAVGAKFAVFNFPVLDLRVLGAKLLTFIVILVCTSGMGQ